MYYKVIKHDATLDVLENLEYVQYQLKHDIFLSCDISEAEGILSSDARTVWHLPGLRDIPIKGYDTVELVEIDSYEYESRKQFGGQTKEEIIDSYTALLVKGDKYQLIDSLSRCFEKDILSENDINKLQNILTQEEIKNILNKE